MRKFILKVSIFITVSVILILLILSLANGYTDEFYVRFTTPLQENLILGTSRAAQSLQPDIFKTNMKLKIYNYAFTVAHSPYGPVYLESIKKKLNPETKNGIFIVTVDPWSISSEISINENEDNFRETNLCLNTTRKVNVNPNFQYLFKNLSGQYYTILLKNLGGKYYNKLSLHKPLFLHHDGWLEVTTKMDSSAVKKRTDHRVKLFREEDSKRSKYSPIRFEYLIKTILFLKKHGKVYLVRLPIDEKVVKIENEFMSNFNEKINEITMLTEGYFDMTPLNEQYVYTDGNHIYKESGKMVTKEIIDWIILKQYEEK